MPINSKVIKSISKYVEPCSFKILPLYMLVDFVIEQLMSWPNKLMERWRRWCGMSLHRASKACQRQIVIMLHDLSTKHCPKKKTLPIKGGPTEGKKTIAQVVSFARRMRKPLAPLCCYSTFIIVGIDARTCIAQIFEALARYGITSHSV